ncbi:MAG: ACT domain-containing protein [Verrucomicrobiaceae bacterium]|nr:MAG: ACT domain-containing protein [Verrucomicrobiaceae bacterium]
MAVCSWDRPGLLMNIAGALSRAGLNILSAEVYTREDHLALDIFEVRETAEHEESHEIRLRYAARLLAAAMAVPHTPGAAELELPSDTQGAPVADEAAVVFDNESSADYTLLRVDARDHIGLLFHLLQDCVAAGVDVKQATILTSGARARDMFCITDADGRKIEDPERLAALHELLCRAASRSMDFDPGLWGIDPLNLIERQP